MMRDPGEQYNVIDLYPEKVEELMMVVFQASQELGDLNGTLNDNLSGIREIKAFTREEIEAARFGAQVNRLRDLETRMASVQSALGPLLQFAAAASVVLMLWLAGMKYTLASIAAALNQTSTLWIFTLAALILREPVTGKRMLGLLLGLGGVALVTFG